MRVHSYLIIVGVISAVGGLLLSAFVFERQLEIRSKSSEVETAALFRNDTLRLSDQIKQLFVTTDLLFGAQETYVLQASKKQVSAALDLCADFLGQLDDSRVAEQNHIGLIRDELAVLKGAIIDLERQAQQAEFSVSSEQLRVFDDTTTQLVNLLQVLDELANAYLDEKRAAQLNANSDLDLFVWLFSIAYVGVVVFVLAWASNSVSKPLARLSRSAEEALADMAAFKPVVGGPREVRSLTRHIGAFVQSLRAKIDEAERMSVELRHQATHDALTGLGNRRSLEYVLRRASGGSNALCVIDLDRFKLVNDTSGHAAGDALLIQVSDILRQEIRADDAVVRMGGDEFALLLRECPAHKAMEIAERIRERVESLVFHWDTTSHRIGCCIGIACTDAEQADVTEVMQNADAACFAAKEAGRNQVVLHDATLEEVSRARSDLQWVQLINAALDNGEFVLYGQALKPLTSSDHFGEVTEVLLRLRDRQANKLVAPGSFMPAAERYGLNTKIDRWVVTAVLTMAQVYGKLFNEKRTYWINLSGASLCDVAFVEFLTDSIRSADITPGSINFEITETAVIRNLSQAAVFIEKLRELGCRFALDDFGSGLSSFGYLKSLPVDIIKIDGMFVKGILEDPIDRKFVQAIIEIANTMDIRTVVEYVEDETVLEAVTLMGADYAQGYGIEKPRTLLPRVWAASESSAIT